MNAFREIMRQVFPQPEAVMKGKIPVISEPVSRSRDFANQFLEWKSSGQFNGIGNLVRSSQHTDFNLSDEYLEIGHYRDRGIEGIVIRRLSYLNADEFRFLFDLLKEKVIGLDYRLYHGITESIEEEGKINTKEEYYLKPAVRNRSFPLEQGYGNITLQLNLLNERFRYLKIISNTYAGFNYKEPRPFTELLEILFSA